MSEKDDNKMEKINELIRDISKGAAFSADAMSQFVDLQSEVDSQESTIKYLRGERETDRDKIGDLTSQLRDAEARIEALESERDSFHSRMSEIQDRENQHTELKVRHEMNEKRVEDHQLMFATVFKGMHMRKQVISPGTPGYADNGCHYGGDPATKHDVEEGE